MTAAAESLVAVKMALALRGVVRVAPAPGARFTAYVVGLAGVGLGPTEEEALRDLLARLRSSLPDDARLAAFRRPGPGEVRL